MTYSEIESLAMRLYENGADIPVSALSVDEHGAKYVHIEANPKTVLFWETDIIPENLNISVSKVTNDPKWVPNYMDTHKRYEGDWKLCNIEAFNEELLSFMDRYIGQFNNIWAILQKVNHDKLL